MHTECSYTRVVERFPVYLVMMVAAAGGGMVGFPVQLLDGRENEERGHTQTQPGEHSPYVGRLADLGVVAPSLESGPRVPRLCHPRRLPP